MQYYRFDLVFSYWILLWYFLHMFGYVRASPKLALLLGLFENMVAAVYILFVSGSIQRTASYVGIVTIIKVMPLYTILYEKIRWRRDIILIDALFLVYTLYVFAVSDKTPVTFYKGMIQTLKEGQYDPTFNPGMAMFHDMYNYITKI